MKTIETAIFSLCLAAPAAFAETCKYVDDAGRVTYSNVTVKGAKKEKCFEPQPPAQPRPPRSAAPAPENFPSVDGDTQRRRDEARHRILEEELAAEEKLLNDARRALEEGEAVRLGDERHNYQKYLDRVQQLRDAVALHEKNVTALRQEIAGMR